MIGSLGSTSAWKDPQETEPERVCKCTNNGCNVDIVEGYEAFIWDDLYFCSTTCFGNHLGLEEAIWS